MKENAYDRASFFEQYSRFPRSVQGLEQAGEWQAFKKMMPNIEGKRVLDLGCGFGWHCRYAAKQGAAWVLGVDLSEKMLAVAKENTTADNIFYRRMAMEDIAFEKDRFDLVISSLTLHYTPDFKDMCQRIAGCLTAGGDFVFSVEHPVFTAQGPQQWHTDQDGKTIHWPVDHYFTEGKRQAIFLGETVVKYHKSLTTYLNTLIDEGFCIRRVVEPQPPEDLLKTVPGMRDELRRPMMLLIAAQKRA